MAESLNGERQMAHKGGVNSEKPAPSGKNSTRINPASFARNNLSKGGVNKDLGGGAKKPGKGKG
jgi:hypothetical protein